MAEDSKKPVFDFSDPNIHTVFANDTAAIVGDAEINLFFSDGSPAAQDGTQKRLNTRVILPHSTFIRMMDFWMTRYDFISSMYNGTPPSITDVRANEPDRYEAAYQEFLVSIKSPEPEDE